jgi:uncharacterized protein (UPF0332 family)
MTHPYADEIAANLERADQSLGAATAAVLAEGLELSKHSGVIASIHQRFVRAGKLSREQGKDLNGG